MSNCLCDEAGMPRLIIACSSKWTFSIILQQFLGQSLLSSLTQRSFKPVVFYNRSRVFVLGFPVHTT